jgi:hypothetical protein
MVSLRGGKKNPLKSLLSASADRGVIDEIISAPTGPKSAGTVKVGSNIRRSSYGPLERNRVLSTSRRTAWAIVVSSQPSTRPAEFTGCSTRSWAVHSYCCSTSSSGAGIATNYQAFDVDHSAGRTAFVARRVQRPSARCASGSSHAGPLP